MSVDFMPSHQSYSTTMSHKSLNLKEYLHQSKIQISYFDLIDEKLS